MIATAQLRVVLDTTVVNVALPHIQDALHFSGSSLEWVVNGYTLAFGGLLLLGGRSGDLLGRRRIFIFGILLFTAASLLGGLATSQEWLLAARAVQAIEGTGATILDTRKTTPGLRTLEKAAVAAGSATNHRAGLYDAILIKENHIAAAGSVAGALTQLGVTASGAPHPRPGGPEPSPYRSPAGRTRRRSVWHSGSVCQFPGTPPWQRG